MNSIFVSVPGTGRFKKGYIGNDEIVTKFLQFCKIPRKDVYLP